MKIEEGVKLDYCDVLIRPKRSKIPSRSKIDLVRTYKMPELNRVWTGVPIVAANMYATGTFAMAIALAKRQMITALHKHYSEDELVDFFLSDESLWDYVFYTIGIRDGDLEKLKNVSLRVLLQRSIYPDNGYVNIDILHQFEKENKANPSPAFIQNVLSSGVFPRMLNIDVANGYSKYFNDKVKEIRKMFPQSILMAGNIVSREMTEQLILSGVNIVKVGIGPGCFVAGTKVKTKDGLKKIENIKVNNEVLTHRVRYKKVVSTLTKKEKKSICSVNDIKCTGNHEFYVLHKKYRDIVNDKNIDEYAEWTAAEDLTKDYLLLKIKKD